eukprot:CAMPEP_0119065872 /NCGR_PEP_ID=MMETSP1178-20130426/8584_1 /TAXON_ID=33656 /ORGANISM="unid sp, Strain CCMP2000" /LENGTH=86 /DNA_ID=CAMNT_0007047427 /DNA_START=328 /DNA_END=584 /DNA_ORIENTATION=+
MPTYWTVRYSPPGGTPGGGGRPAKTGCMGATGATGIPETTGDGAAPQAGTWTWITWPGPQFAGQLTLINCPFTLTWKGWPGEVAGG